MHRNSPHDIVRFKERSSLIVCSHLLLRVDTLLRAFRNSAILFWTLSRLSIFLPFSRQKELLYDSLSHQSSLVEVALQLNQHMRKAYR